MIGLRFDMRLGPDTDPRSAYRAAIEMVEWSEESFAPFVTLSEHHAVADGYLTSPATLAAAMAARTSSTFFLVTAAILPLYDPVRLAEEIALVDHISGGRVGWVLGLGYRPEEYAMLGVDFARRGRIADEHLATPLDALTPAAAELLRDALVRLVPVLRALEHVIVTVTREQEVA